MTEILTLYVWWVFFNSFNLVLTVLKLNFYSTEREAGKPKYDHERPEGGAPEAYVPPPLASAPSSSHFPVPALSSTITVIAPTHHGNSTTESWSEFHQDHVPYGRAAPPPLRKRCRDYDGKGIVYVTVYAALGIDN